MDEEMKKKKIRIFRNSTLKNTCYRYFITTEAQLKEFLEAREYGTTLGPNKSYHVYVDEETDRHSTEYKQLFKLSREIDEVN